MLLQIYIGVMQSRIGLMIGLLWAQYYTPRLMSLAYTQATLLYEPIGLNPAASLPLRYVSATVSGAFYLLSPEIGFYTGGASYSWDSLQGMHVLLQHWGFDKITQSEAGAGYALRLLQSKLTLGVRGRLMSTNFSEYGRLYRFTPDAGFVFKLSPRLLIGGYGYNLLARGWGFLPGYTFYGVGIAYQPSPEAQVMTELTHAAGGPSQIRTAFVYAAHSSIQLRGGVSLPIILVGAGLSIRYQRVAMDIGYTYQPTTGSWTGIGISLP